MVVFLKWHEIEDRATGRHQEILASAAIVAALVRLSAGPVALAQDTPETRWARPSTHGRRKQRVVVMTDIANEPDDQVSMVRFLVYSNQFDVEGLITTTSTWMKNELDPDVLQMLVAAYDEARPNRVKHQPGFPAAESLRAVIVPRHLGGKRLPLRTQADHPEFSGFVENHAVLASGVTFATVHLLGSRNGLPLRFRSAPRRTMRKCSAAQKPRRRGCASYFRKRQLRPAASVIVVAFHGTLGFGQPTEARRARASRLSPRSEEEVERFGNARAHGAWRCPQVDHRSSSRAEHDRPPWLAEKLTRLEVPGSPDVGWVRVVVTPGATQPFALPAADRYRLEVLVGCGASSTLKTPVLNDLASAIERRRETGQILYFSVP